MMLLTENTSDTVYKKLAMRMLMMTMLTMKMVMMRKSKKNVLPPKVLILRILVAMMKLQHVM